MAKLYLLLWLLLGVGLVGCDQVSSSQSAASGTINGPLVENFALLDQQGQFHSLHYYSDAKLIVLFVQGNGCPIVRNALPALHEIRTEFADKGIEFLLINANLQDTRASVAAEADAFGIDFPILIDETQLIAESLNITRTAEAIVIDPNAWRMIYRGPIDDRLGYETQKKEAQQHYLRDVLTAYLNDEPVDFKERETLGCIISLPDRYQTISYSEQVAPILQQRCQICHQDGGVAPWAMTNYQAIKGWSPMMREVIRTKRMPPWQADPHVGTFSNDLSLTVSETQTLVHWIEQGSPRGEGVDPLQEQPVSVEQWPLGVPDLMLTLAQQTIPATGLIDYRYQTAAIPISEDTWVRAVDFRPGNRTVLHHGFAFLMPPLKEGEDAGQARLKASDVFATYGPGIEPEAFPEGVGRKLPKGSQFMVELHYTASGREEMDTPQIGLYFSTEKPKSLFRVDGLYNDKIEIPPRTKHYQAEADYVFNQDVILYGLLPHMHYRGKSAQFVAHYPDGSEELLLSVPNYNFNWQRYYNLRQPKPLPAGTRIVLIGVFDNSSQNPANPDPEKMVTWGAFSTDEMLAGYLTFRYQNETLD